MKTYHCSLCDREMSVEHQDELPHKSHGCDHIWELGDADDLPSLDLPPLEGQEAPSPTPPNRIPPLPRV